MLEVNCKSDLGTPETQRRGIQVGYTPGGERIACVTHQRRIDTMFRRDVISQDQYAAGNAILKDSYFAGLQARIKSSADIGLGGAGDIEAQLDAKRRYHEAVNKLTGVERAVIMWVVLDDGYLKDFQSDGNVSFSVTEVLKDALDKLAFFYGITSKG
jgi:hypothetical protein